MSKKTMEVARVKLYINEIYCPNIFGTVSFEGKLFDFLEEGDEIRVGNNPTPTEMKAVETAVKAFERRKARPLMVAGV